MIFKLHCIPAPLLVVDNLMLLKEQLVQLMSNFLVEPKIVGHLVEYQPQGSRQLVVDQSTADKKGLVRDNMPVAFGRGN